MRIAVMVDRLEVGGVEKVAMQQVKALRAAGQDAVLVMLKRRGEGLEAYREELAALPALVLEDRLPPPLRVSVGVPGFSFLETFHLTFPLLARRMVRPGEFDVILCHGSYTCLTAYAIRRTRGIPVAGLIWDPTFHVVSGPAYAGRALGRLRFLLAPLTRRFDRWLVRTPDLVVLGGLAYRDYVAALGPRRLLIQHPAVEVSASVRPASERRPEILAVTAWKHGKQPARLLGLIERHPGMRLVLAGAWLDEALLREFTAEVERRGLTDRVEITGPLSESELAERYATVRFVVQTWHSPGFGLSPLEAAAQGTTFVMPTGQGSAELFRDGVDGLMFSPDDANALHRAVALLVSDPERAGAMGLSAWRHARARASWTLRARELADALADAAARS